MQVYVELDNAKAASLEVFDLAGAARQRYASWHLTGAADAVASPTGFEFEMNLLRDLSLRCKLFHGKDVATLLDGESLGGRSKVATG